ncbi:hypothetical protein HAX54_031643 [Datura stramonium]|uniref:Uncharacterized protein n=1 Tax=Datura stramonium TaxID=4076 RepID=A0ABS8SC46_DATST|nr:hypothetical protein [Datura stramonium]
MYSSLSPTVTQSPGQSLSGMGTVLLPAKSGLQGNANVEGLSPTVEEHAPWVWQAKTTHPEEDQQQDHHAPEEQMVNPPAVLSTQVESVGDIILGE